MPPADIALRVIAFLAGVTVAVRAAASAVRVIVLPRPLNDAVARALFLASRRVFNRLAHGRPYATRDRILAYYAPVTLLLLPIMWLAMVALGFTAIYWALGVDDVFDAFRLSGSSLLTLGFASADGLPQTVAAFGEAIVGLGLVALLIAYLPTMYAAFSRRELAVNLLEIRADSPPSAIAMLQRFHRLGTMSQLPEQFAFWESWFADLEETHTSLAALAFFRSPQRDHSWVNASGAILDCAALYRSLIDVPKDVQADLTIRAGYLALRRIADFFRIPYDREPGPTSSCSITQEDFEIACDELAAYGIALKPDRERAWRDFRGWRVNYDQALLALAALTVAPPARWNGRPWEVIEPVNPSLFRRA